MAKKLRYPIRRHTRLSVETDRKLRALAKKRKVPPAVVMRAIIESAFQGDIEHD